MNSFRQLKLINLLMDLSSFSDSVDAKSRALDNLGRVHARSGEYAKAIEVHKTVRCGKIRLQ